VHDDLGVAEALAPAFGSGKAITTLANQRKFSIAGRFRCLTQGYCVSCRNRRMMSRTVWERLFKVGTISSPLAGPSPNVTEKWTSPFFLSLGFKGNGSTESMPAGQRDITAIDSSIFVFQLNACNACDSDCWDKETMFVVNVEVMEGQNIPVPSLVTLHNVHKKVENSGVGVYTSICAGKYALKPLFGLLGVDGKLGPVPSARPKRPGEFPATRYQ
jgi:hypothetical protein